MNAGQHPAQPSFRLLSSVLPLASTCFHKRTNNFASETKSLQTSKPRSTLPNTQILSNISRTEPEVSSPFFTLNPFLFLCCSIFLFLFFCSSVCLFSVFLFLCFSVCMLLCFSCQDLQGLYPFLKVQERLF